MRQVRQRMSTTWSVDAGACRAEVNGALSRTGQRIAAELLGADKWPPASFSRTHRVMQANSDGTDVSRARLLLNQL